MQYISPHPGFHYVTAPSLKDQITGLPAPEALCIPISIPGYIAFEGVDFSGKSTLLAAAAKEFIARTGENNPPAIGRATVFHLREPFWRSFGKEILNTLLEQLLTGRRSGGIETALLNELPPRYFPSGFASASGEESGRLEDFVRKSGQWALIHSQRVALYSHLFAGNFFVPENSHAMYTSTAWNPMFNGPSRFRGRSEGRGSGYTGIKNMRRWGIGRIDEDGAINPPSEDFGVSMRGSAMDTDSIIGAMEKMNFLFSDRCFLSSLVYQYNPDLISTIWENTVKLVFQCGKPEIIFWVDTPETVLSERFSSQQTTTRDLYSFEENVFRREGAVTALVEGYRTWFEESDRLGLNIVRIDGSLPLEQQVAAVMERLVPWFSFGASHP